MSKAGIPTPDTCQTCHEAQGAQFKEGKHALAWAAMKAMPTAHWQPMALTEGMKGCGGCHKLGLKTEAEIRELKEGGLASGLPPAMRVTLVTPSPFRRPDNRNPVKPVTWASITRSGRCILLPSTVLGFC